MLYPDNLEDIMVRLDTNTLQKMCIINKNAYAICNNKHFWLKKYQYDGYSTFIFNYYNYINDFENYFYEYNNVLTCHERMNNIIMTMRIESKYDQYKNNFIRINNFDGISEIYLDFLKDKNNKYFKILEDNNYSHTHLDIKYNGDNFEFYLDKEDVLLFNKLDTIEFLMAYSKIENRYLYDQNGIVYIEYIEKNDTIFLRRQGIVATLQYI